MKKQTRKDKNKRTWPAGTNSISNKREARRLWRRISKKWQDLSAGWYRKVFNHYDINDFK